MGNPRAPIKIHYNDNDLKVTLSFSADRTLMDHIESFTSFLKGIGYSVDSDKWNPQHVNIPVSASLIIKQQEADISQLKKAIEALKEQNKEKDKEINILTLKLEGLKALKESPMTIVTVDSLGQFTARRAVDLDDIVPTEELNKLLEDYSDRLIDPESHGKKCDHLTEKDWDILVEDPYGFADCKKKKKSKSKGK